MAGAAQLALHISHASSGQQLGHRSHKRQGTGVGEGASSGTGGLCLRVLQAGAHKALVLTQECWAGLDNPLPTDSHDGKAASLGATLPGQHQHGEGTPRVAPLAGAQDVMPGGPSALLTLGSGS